MTNIKESFDNVDIISSADLKANLYDPKSFDYQSPFGSICQYGFDDVSDYGNPNLFLNLILNFPLNYAQNIMIISPLSALVGKVAVNQIG